MRRSYVQILIGLCFLAGQSSLLQAADPEDNRTETTEEAEFRQGGIGQQLMSGYPVVAGLYGGGANPAGFQYAAAASNNAGTGYVNMLRNLYRPPSLGLTDKVKHWVKSFMNRRQYVKPYYNPSMSNLQYSVDELGSKPMFVGANGYKAISVPLRQLQKYYKPYYAAGEGGAVLQSQQPGSGSSASGSILSYSPGAASGGFYTNEAAGQFAGSGIFGADGNSALFAGGSGASASGNPFAGGQGAGLFSQGASSGGLYSGSEGAASALFSASGLQGTGGYYGSSGSPGSGYQSSSNQAGYSLEGAGSSLYGSETANSPYYGSSSGSGRNTGLLSSLNSGGSNSGSYGDLYASGASPAATVYNPNQGGEQGRGGYGSKKHSSSPSSSSSSSSGSYGAGSSALYMSSSDQRNSEASYSAKEPVNSFNVDSSRGSPQEPHSYSVSFQPSAQGKSYGASGFQPVSFGADSGFQGKSS